MATQIKTLDRQLIKIIFFLFNLLVLITPFVFTWVNEELFEFSKMLVTYAFTIVIVGAWLLRMIISQRLIFKKTKLDWPLLAFVISQILATVFSLHPRTSILGYYTRFHGGLLSTATYALLYWALVSNFNYQQIKKIITSALLAAVGISLYAIPEHFGFSPSCLLIRGKFDVSCWVQDVRSRVFATFGQPNWLAAYLITLLPAGISSYLKRKLSHKNEQVAGWIFLAVMAVYIALLFTQSRSGLLGLAIGLAFYFGWQLIHKIKSQAKDRDSNQQLLPSLMVAAALTAATFVIGTDFSPNLNQIVSHVKSNYFQEQASPAQNSTTQTTSKTETRTTANPNINITPSEKIRFIVWKGALKVWQRYPVLGSGPGTFAYSYYQDRPPAHNLVSEWDFLYNKAHNEWLNYLAESGLVGLTTYLWLIGATLYLAWKQIVGCHNQYKQLWLVGLTASLIALHVSNFLGFSTVMVSILWVIFSANIAASHHKPTTSQQSQQKRPLNLIPIITIMMLIIIQIHLLLKVVSIWQADYYFTRGKSLASTQEYQDAVEYFQRAINLSPQEALFSDELASLYADIASQLQTINEQAAAQHYTKLAITASDKALALNPHLLNFYQSRAAIYSKLAVVNDDYLQSARDTLQTAQLLAPTHPKLVYQEGLIAHNQGKTEAAVKLIKKAITMKPNYHQARYKLGQIYEQQEQYQLALEQYQFILDYLIPNDPYLPDRIKALQTKIK